MGGAAASLIYLASGSFDPLSQSPRLAAGEALDPAQAAAGGVYLVQFHGPIKPEWKQAIRKAGGQIGNYVPDYAFLIHLTPQARAIVAGLPFVRWIGPYQPGYKLAASAGKGGRRSYRLLLAPWAIRDQVETSLQSISTELRRSGFGFTAVLDEETLLLAARLPGVVWIEPYKLMRPQNDIAGGGLIGGASAWNRDLTGAGQVVSLTDTGLDTGNPASIHLDFSGRVDHINSWPVVSADYGFGCKTVNAGSDDGAGDLETGHGTHVAGSLGGNGARSAGQFKGISYQAELIFQAVEQYTLWASPNRRCPNGYYLSGIPDDLRDLLAQAYNLGSRTHNISWNGGDPGVYEMPEAQIDDFIFNHPDMAVSISAGNSGIDYNKDGYVDLGSIEPPATAKNPITVGATDSERFSGGLADYTWGQAWPSDFPLAPTSLDLISDSRQELAAFSSRGPLSDGRLKPDLVAPGTNIISTRSSLTAFVGWGVYDAYYLYLGGTSMASPLAAGAAALVRQYYQAIEGQPDPSAALIKATLINTAVDLQGYGSPYQEAGLPIPNPHEGWGAIDLEAATAPGLRQVVDHTRGIDTGDTFTYAYNLRPGRPLKVTLAWNDYPGFPGAGKALVNNLDLRVTAPDGVNTYLGNVFAGGWSRLGGSPDYLNNVENVYVEVPAEGDWVVQVVGQNVPEGPQPFALVVSGDITPVQHLEVMAIHPDHAPNNAAQQGVVVMGSGFTAKSYLRLVHGDEFIYGTTLGLDVDSDVLTASVNLVGATPGQWAAQVINSISETATLERAFTVIDASLPDLKLDNTGSADHLQPGDWLTYTLQIHNAGYSHAHQVVFTDSLPSKASFYSLDPGCKNPLVIEANAFTCQIASGMLQPGNTITYTLVVSVSLGAQGLLANVAWVAAAEPDLYPDDNRIVTQTLVGWGDTYLPLVYQAPSSRASRFR